MGDETTGLSPEALRVLIESNDRRYMEHFLSQEKATSLALAASEKAAEKAEANQLRVNAAQNEFRGALTDAAQVASVKAKEFVTAPILDARLDGLSTRLGLLERSMSAASGRQALSSKWWALGSFILGAVIVWFITHSGTVPVLPGK